MTVITFKQDTQLFHGSSAHPVGRREVYVTYGMLASLHCSANTIQCSGFVDIDEVRLSIM